jgi:hypothetical protein
LPTLPCLAANTKMMMGYGNGMLPFGLRAIPGSGPIGYRTTVNRKSLGVLLWRLWTKRSRNGKQSQSAYDLLGPCTCPTISVPASAVSARNSVGCFGAVTGDRTSTGCGYGYEDGQNTLFGGAMTAPETAECGALLASACSKHSFWRGTKTVRSWSAGKTMPGGTYL